MSHDPAALLTAAAGGDRRALGRLLSLVESGGEAARALSRLVVGPAAGVDQVVGITGAPGAGKSTLTDGFVGQLRDHGCPVAVLAVDPSSPFGGGALLGDRVRMAGHTGDSGVFIRSMASRGHLGGLAAAAPEAVRVLAAAGFPVVLVETVGVGQSEVEVAGATDTTVVVVNPGWGDDIQANKAGLLEVADVFVVNKADRPGAEVTRRDLEAMLDLGIGAGPHEAAGTAWRPPVLLASASTGAGVAEVWTAVRDHRAYLVATGGLEARRRGRLVGESLAILARRREQDATALLGGAEGRQIVAALSGGTLDPPGAADRLAALLAAGPG